MASFRAAASSLNDIPQWLMIIAIIAAFNALLIALVLIVLKNRGD
jgi:hypothetical protein